MNRIERLELDLYNSSYKKMYNKIYNHDIDDDYMAIINRTANIIAETNPIINDYTYLYDLVVNQLQGTLNLPKTYEDYYNWTYQKPIDAYDYLTINYYTHTIQKYFQDVYREYFVYNKEQEYKIKTEILQQYPDETVVGKNNIFYIYYDEDNIALTYIYINDAWMQITNDSEVTDLNTGILSKIIALLEDANTYITLCSDLVDDTTILEDNITQLYNDANYIVKADKSIYVKSFIDTPDKFLDFTQYTLTGKKGEQGDRGVNGIWEDLIISDNTISIADNSITLTELDSNELSETLLVKSIESGLIFLNNIQGFNLKCGIGKKGETGSTGNRLFDITLNNSTLTIQTDSGTSSYTYSDIFTNEEEINIDWVGNYYDTNYNYAIVSDINKDSGVEGNISSETLVAFGETDLETQLGNISFDYWDVYSGEITYTGSSNYLGRIALPYEQTDPQNYLTDIYTLDDQLHIKLSDNNEFTLPLSYKYSNAIHYDFDIDTIDFDYGSDKVVKRIQKGITDLFYTQSNNEKPTNVGLIIDNKDFLYFGIDNNVNDIQFAVTSYSTPENVFISTLTIDEQYIITIPEIKNETFKGLAGKGFEPILENNVLKFGNLELPLTLTSYYEFANNANNIILTQYYHNDKIQKQLIFNKDFYGENSDIGIQNIIIEPTDYGTIVNLITNDSTIPLTIYNIIGYDNIVTFDNTSIYVDDKLQITIEELEPIYRLVDYTENVNSYILNFTNDYHYPITNATIVGNYVTEFTNSKSIIGTNCANNDNTITNYYLSDYFAGSCIDVDTAITITNDLAIDVTIHCITNEEVTITSIAPNSTFIIDSTMYMWYVLKVGKETEKILELEQEEVNDASNDN